MSEIATRYDSKRGCGWRKPGGLYLIAEGPSRLCGKLPLPLSVCPTCHAGIKQSRGWTWIAPQTMFDSKRCVGSNSCVGCPLFALPEKAGLLWVGGIFYKTPGTWSEEAVRQGVSRRIKAIPKGFVVGETLVLVAHHEVPQAGGDPIPAVFHAFIPTALEYVVKGNETEEELTALEKRKITPVRIERQELVEAEV